MVAAWMAVNIGYAAICGVCWIDQSIILCLIKHHLPVCQDTIEIPYATRLRNGTQCKVVIQWALDPCHILKFTISKDKMNGRSRCKCTSPVKNCPVIMRGTWWTISNKKWERKKNLCVSQEMDNISCAFIIVLCWWLLTNVDYVEGFKFWPLFCIRLSSINRTWNTSQSLLFHTEINQYSKNEQQTKKLIIVVGCPFFSARGPDDSLHHHLAFFFALCSLLFHSRVWEMSSFNSKPYCRGWYWCQWWWPFVIVILIVYLWMSG